MKIRTFFFICLALLLFSCQHKQTQLVSIQGVVFGTYYNIKYYSLKAEVFQEEIDSLFNHFNESMSYYIPNSLISRINRNETQVVDDYFKTVYKRSLQIFNETNGAFDPTVSPLVNAWGFGFSKKAEITPQKIDSLRSLIGLDRTYLENHTLVKEDPRIQFDFNAIAKGYAADVIGNFLEKKGINVYMVEIGGDLTTRGIKPDGSKWRIGLEKPAAKMDDLQQWDYFVELENMAVATSGNYRRYYEEAGQRYSHTIDPFTGYPVNHSLLSVSVFAKDAMSADAYATAFMVMGFEKAKDFVELHPELEAYFIFSESGDSIQSYATTGLSLIERPGM